MQRAGMRECPACGTRDPEAAWTDDGLTCLECGHVVTQAEQEASMPDKQPLVDRVRAEYERRRLERQLRGEEAPPVTRPGDPPLITRPHDWPVDGEEWHGVTPRMLLTPHERDPVVFIPREQQEALLFASLDGVRLGEWDKRIVRWLAGLDGSTVLPLVAMIRRSRAVGGGEGWAAALEQEGGEAPRTTPPD
jgi:Zn ribbon nucleic-acid-binding protein